MASASPRRNIALFAGRRSLPVVQAVDFRCSKCQELLRVASAVPAYGEIGSKRTAGQ